MKSSESRQLKFVFAANSKECRNDSKTDKSVGKSYLQHTAKDTLTNDSDAPTSERDVDPDRLLEDVASLPNLARALQFVAKNKGAAGVDRVSVEEVVESAADLLPKIRDALLSGHYQPGDIRRVWIPKSGGGRRGLGIPNVIDRVVQQAVRLRIEPLFEPHFHTSSHGFRPRRGAQTAIAEAEGYFKEGYGITVDIDLSQFFDRVNHQRLLGRMSQRVRDNRVVKLISRMLKAKVAMPDGTRVVNDEGTPQGGPLSPLLSNIVLDELDWELSRRGLRFVRYADDFSIFVRSSRAGERVMTSVQRFLETKLLLQVNEEKSSVSRPFDLTFLGFRLRKGTKGTFMIGLSDRSKLRLATKIRELTPRNWGDSLLSCMGKLNQYLQGWFGYFRLITTKTILQTSDAHIRRRLRSILIRQKKRPRFLYRHLLSRDVSHGSAWQTCYGLRSHWKKSKSRGIHRAYPNVWFSRRLVSLFDLWLSLSQPGALKQLELF